MNVALLAGSGPLNLKVVYCLQRLGARIHVVATSTSNVVRWSRHVCTLEVNAGVADESATDATVRWLKGFCERHLIAVIIPGDIGTAGFLASAGDVFGGSLIYPCSSATLLDHIHDKWQFALTLTNAGIPTPKTALIASAADIDAAASAIGFPMMVKPLAGESSHGVVRIDSRSRLQSHVTGGASYSAPPLIAQQFIDGPDIDISVLADHGRIVLGVTQQLQTDGSLRFFHDTRTRQLAESIVATYGYHGIAHFDMRVDQNSGNVLALECNPRFWYSMPASMWQGVNFVEAGIRLARGEKIGDGEHLVEGTYFLPGVLLAAIRHPRRLKRLTARNIRGLLQPALDPMPHLIDLYRKWRH